MLHLSINNGHKLKFILHQHSLSVIRHLSIIILGILASPASAYLPGVGYGYVGLSSPVYGGLGLARGLAYGTYGTLPYGGANGRVIIHSPPVGPVSPPFGGLGYLAGLAHPVVGWRICSLRSHGVDFDFCSESMETT